MAVASATWSAHLLDLWRGGRGRDTDRCSCALSYLLIKLMLKISTLPPPFYHIQACVRTFQYLSQLYSFSNYTQSLVGRGGEVWILTSFILF